MKDLKISLGRTSVFTMHWRPFAKTPGKLIDRKIQISNKSCWSWRPALTVASTAASTHCLCVGRWRLPMDLGSEASVGTGATIRLVLSVERLKSTHSGLLEDKE